MATKVFYAWQLDRDRRINRRLIGSAAQQAINELSARAKVVRAPRVELDHDRKGITGHPHIALEIRKKIRACHVFLADLTHVGEYVTADGRAKKAQNGNVLVELGIALRYMGSKRFILVMNTAFGSVEDLPFDLKHHSFPIQYDLADASDKAKVRAVRNKLAVDIANSLKPMLTEIAAQPEARWPLEVTITCIKDQRPGEQHVRWLHVDVVNHGTELNSVRAVIEVSARDGRVIESPLLPFGTIPEPFKPGYSFRFGCYNDDPTKSFEPLEGIRAEQVSIIVYSGVREMARLAATQWLKQFDALRDVDNTIPPKPARKPKRDTVSYLDAMNSFRRLQDRW